MNRKVLLAAAALLSGIYFLSWFPALSFHWIFQRGEILRHDPASGLGSILWARTLPTAEAASAPAPGGSPSAGAFGEVLHDGFLLPLPPGRLRRIAAEGSTLVIEFDEGKILLDRFPPGFVRSLYLGELTRVGGDAEARRDVTEPRALLRVAGSTPDEYSIGMSTAARYEYAGAILTKLLLWPPPPGVEVGSGNHGGSGEVHTWLEADGRKAAVLLEAGGSGRGIATSPDGVVIFALPPNCPPAWSKTLEAWSRFHPVSEQDAKQWREEAHQKLPEGHPLRVWAESTPPPTH